ncbi:MAG: flagellar basal-body rod protein FlgF [Ferrovum sp.]|nr:flagellar basal-body rod protein FlgF [Ferrovum sp.]NDU88092.1 flagellar basal-body rod protein FlgF [Ferrovum sp.]
MDRLIYTAMTGASHILERQATLSNNLANNNTTGYRSAIDSFRAIPLNGQGVQTRTFVVNGLAGYDFSPATLAQTGRSLDVGIDGKGWIAVLMPDGSEAYTRNGNLQVSPDGVLQTNNGNPVIDDNGEPIATDQIVIPPDSQVTIAADGTVSTVPTGAPPSQATLIGKLRLVDPPESQLIRGEDGLFRTRDKKPVPPSTTVSVSAEHLESSNVNAISAMVDMISISKQFELHMQMLQTAQSNDQQATQILASLR